MNNALHMYHFDDNNVFQIGIIDVVEAESF